jgi:hypothetical protein
LPRGKLLDLAAPELYLNKMMFDVI